MNNPKGFVRKRFSVVIDLNEDSINKIKDIDYSIMSQFY